MTLTIWGEPAVIQKGRACPRATAVAHREPDQLDRRRLGGLKVSSRPEAVQ